MKKFLIYISILMLSIFAIFLYPRKITHAVFIQSSGADSIMYIEGKAKKVKIPNLAYKKYTVVNFRYNILGIFDLKEVSSLSNRIMIKNSNSYELEALGSTALSKSPVYYKIDKNDNLTSATARDIIVGKTNVISFIHKNKLKTFIIHPIDYSNTRIGISTTNFESIYHNNLELTSTSSFNLYSLIDKSSLRIPEGSTLTAHIDNGELNISIGSFKKTFTERIYLQGKSFTINNIIRGVPKFNPTYDGILELYPTKSGIILINEVSLENYLTKVVPSEMPSWGGLESLKCQAIAARTYAISDMLGNRYSNLGFYVDDSTKSQVYNNTNPLELPNRAIEETKGLIMTFQNKPIDAKYYSTSPGTGVNYKDIWFNSDDTSDYKPYLQTSNYLDDGLPLPNSEQSWLEFYKNNEIKSFDNKSPYYRWKLSFSKETLEKNLNINLNKIYKSAPEYISIYKNTKSKKKLKKLPKELKNLNSIEVLQRSAGGNLLEISFIFDNAIVSVKKDSYIRRVFSNSSNIDKVDIIQHTGKILENWSTLPASFFSLERTDNTFTIYGGGYGHGVGMSQYGAMYLSQNKKDYKSILNTYYKDIDIKYIY